MSIFDLISKVPNKELLFEDKSVCICIYRVALSNIEQQIIMRLCILDYQANSFGSPQNISRCLIKANTQNISNPSGRQDNSQKNVVIIENMFYDIFQIPSKSSESAFNLQNQEDQRNMQSRSNENFTGQNIGQQIITAKQYSNDFIKKMENYKIIYKDSQQPNTYLLNEKFSINLMEILSSNLKLDYLKKPKDYDCQIDQEGQYMRAKKKWERLTGFMLNIDKIQLQLGEISESLIELLRFSGFISLNPKFEQSMNIPKYDLTSTGFHYVLLDTPTQVHIILRKYIEFIQNKYKDLSNGQITIELIKIIFNFALSEFNKVYKLRNRRIEERLQQIIKKDFEQMGLVEFINQNDQELFFITKLMQKFLLTQIGNLQNQQVEMSSFQSNQKNDKFIIIENNLNVFAYTDNKLYREILKKIIEPKREFSNMLHGVMTRNRVEQAFTQNISTKQIMNFLETHSHPEAIYQKVRKIESETHLSKQIGQNQNDQIMMGSTIKKESISSFFGISQAQNRGLQSVSQQLEIWEQQLKGFKEKETILLEFDHGKMKIDEKNKKLLKGNIQLDPVADSNKIARAAFPGGSNPGNRIQELSKEDKLQADQERWRIQEFRRLAFQYKVPCENQFTSKDKLRFIIDKEYERQVFKILEDLERLQQ